MNHTPPPQEHNQLTRTAPPKVGRHSRYDPSWSDRVLELGEQGMTRAQIARELGVSRSVLYRTMENEPEFRAAMDWATDLALAFWTKKAAAACNDRNSNASLIQFMLANMFPKDFSLRKDVAITGPNGGPIPLQAVRSLSRAELERLAGCAIAEDLEPKQLPELAGAET